MHVPTADAAILMCVEIHNELVPDPRWSRAFDELRRSIELSYYTAQEGLREVETVWLDD